MSSDKQKKKSTKNNSGGSKANWIYKVTILAFGLSVFFSTISEFLLEKVNFLTSLFILFIIIIIGIFFDIIGIAVTSSDEAPFHAMAADKVPGGKEAVRLVRNADIVSNFCNDVIGDICGIISGAAGAAIVLKISSGGYTKYEVLISIILTGIISTVTIGGKALGKSIALNNSKTVVYSVGLIIYKLRNNLGLNLLPDSANNRKNGRSGKK